MNQPQMKNDSVNLSVLKSTSKRDSLSFQSKLLKVQGDDQQTKKVYIFRGIVVFSIILIFFLRFALPQDFITLTNQQAFKQANNKTCNPTQFESTSFKLNCVQFAPANPRIGLFMKNLNNLNQLIMVYFKITHKPTEAITDKLVHNIFVTQSVLKKMYNEQTKQTQFYLRNQVSQDRFNFTFSNTNFIGHQTEQTPQGAKRASKYFFGFSRILLNLQNEPTNYVVIVNFTNYDLAKVYQKIQIQATTINPKFTVFTIVLRAVFCGFSIVTLAIYFKRYCQISPQNRSIQIKNIAIISFLLVLFNDPFYAITVLKPNTLSTFVSSLFVIVFLVYLQFLWILFLRRIYDEQNKKQTQLISISKTWPFYVVLFLVFVFSIVMYCQYAYFSLQNMPLVQYTDIQKIKVIPIIIILAILMVGIFLYQIVLFILIVKKYIYQQEGKLFFRNKTYLVVHLFFLIMFVLCFIFGAAMPFIYEPTWILYQYSFMNMFIFILQYLYYTPASSLQNCEQLGPVSSDKISETSDIQIKSVKLKNPKNKSKKYQVNTAQQQASQA